MPQLILDISSEKYADLIKELLKRFKGVKVNIFETELSASQISKRILRPNLSQPTNPFFAPTCPYPQIPSQQSSRVADAALV